MPCSRPSPPLASAGTPSSRALPHGSECPPIRSRTPTTGHGSSTPICRMLSAPSGSQNQTKEGRHSLALRRPTHRRFLSDVSYGELGTISIVNVLGTDFHLLLEVVAHVPAVSGVSGSSFFFGTDPVVLMV